VNLLRGAVVSAFSFVKPPNIHQLLQMFLLAEFKNAKCDSISVHNAV